MRPVTFAEFATAELDRFAADLRRDKRRQARAMGLELTDIFSIVFAEQAGRHGSR